MSTSARRPTDWQQEQQEAQRTDFSRGGDKVTRAELGYRLLTGGGTVLLSSILQDCLDVIRENDGSRNAVHMTYTTEIDVTLNEA